MCVFNLREYLANNADRHNKNAEIIRKLKAEIYKEFPDLLPEIKNIIERNL